MNRAFDVAQGKNVCDIYTVDIFSAMRARLSRFGYFRMRVLSQTAGNTPESYNEYLQVKQVTFETRYNYCKSQSINFLRLPPVENAINGIIKGSKTILVNGAH